MNYKRKKSRRNVRCTICTQHRWLGNSKERRPMRDHRSADSRIRQNEAW